ncbi:hypothetical protein Pelo_18501 [Pelomyxa schiedti]|nr:hypothetical protein Pelo_18501 [Pelomyxa schiedti]
MTGAPGRWLRDIPDEMPISEVITAFRRKWVDKDRASLYKKEVAARKQEPSELVTDYIREQEERWLQINPRMSAKKLVKRIRKGLLPDIQEGVVRAKAVDSVEMLTAQAQCEEEARRVAEEARQARRDTRDEALLIQTNSPATDSDGSDGSTDEDKPTRKRHHSSQSTQRKPKPPKKAKTTEGEGGQGVEERRDLLRTMGRLREEMENHRALLSSSPSNGGDHPQGNKPASTPHATTTSQQPHGMLYGTPPSMPQQNGAPGPMITVPPTYAPPMASPPTQSLLAIPPTPPPTEQHRSSEGASRSRANPTQLSAEHSNAPTQHSKVFTPEDTTEKDPTNEHSNHTEPEAEEGEKMVIMGKVCLFEEGKVRATLPRIKGRIAGKKVALTLDTGATLSILDETTFRWLQTTRDDITRSPWCGRVAGIGGRAAATGRTIVPLHACGQRLQHEFVTMQGCPVQVLVGMDLLGKLKAELNIAEGRIQCGDWMKNFAGPAGCGIKSALMATADCYVKPGDEGAVAIESNNPDDAGRTLSVRSAVLPRGMVHVKEGTTTLDQQRVGRLTIANSGTTDVVIKRGQLVALAKTGIFTTPDDTSATPILQRIGKRAAVAISREVDDAQQ